MGIIKVLPPKTGEASIDVKKEVEEKQDKKKRVGLIKVLPKKIERETPRIKAEPTKEVVEPEKKVAVKKPAKKKGSAIGRFLFGGTKFFTEAIPETIGFLESVGEKLTFIGEKVIPATVKAGVDFLESEETREIAKREFGLGTIEAASALDTSLGIGLQKIGFEQTGQKIKDIAARGLEAKDQIETKLNLAESGVKVEDPKKFADALQDPLFVVKGVARSLPNMLLSMGVTLPAVVAGAPAVVIGGISFGTSAALEGGFAFNEAKKFGATEEQAEKAAILTGVVNGFIESLPIDEVLQRSPLGGQIRKKILSKVVERVVSQGFFEGTTESLQEIVSNVVATTYDENRDILQGVPEAFFFGDLSGGLVSGTIDFASIAPKNIGLTIQDVTELSIDDQKLMDKLKEFDEKIAKKKELPADADKQIDKLVAQAGIEEGAVPTKLNVQTRSFLLKKQVIAKNPLFILTHPISEDRIDGRLNDIALKVGEVLPDTDLSNKVRGLSEKLKGEKATPNDFFDEVSKLFKKDDQITPALYDGLIKTTNDFYISNGTTMPQTIRTKLLESVQDSRANDAITGEERIKQGKDIIPRGKRAITSVADIIKTTPTVIENVRKALLLEPEKNQILNPKMVKDRFENDIILKFERRGVTDDALIASIKKIDPNNISNPAEFALRVIDVLRDFGQDTNKELLTDVIDTASDFQTAINFGSKDVFVSKDQPKFLRGVEKEIREKVTEKTKALKEKARKKATAIKEKTKREVAVTKEIVKRGVEVTKQKIIKKDEVTKLKRAGELKTLRQRIVDRVTFIDRGVREGTIATKDQIKEIQNEVLNILEASELEPADRDKFRRTVKNIQTQKQLQAAIPEIKDRIIELETRAEVRKLKAEIKKEIKKTRPKKQAGKPVGKFTPEIQSTLDQFRKVISLPKAESLDRLINNVNKTEGEIMPAEVARENRIIELLNGTPEELNTLLTQIKQMIDTGKTLAALKEFNIEADISNKKSVLVEQMTGGKGIPEGLQTTGRKEKSTSQKLISEFKALGKKWVVSWDGLMDILDFNSSVENQKLSKIFSVQKQETDYKGLQFDYTQDFNSLIAESYSIENKPTKIHRKIIDSNKPIKIGVFKNSIGQTVDLTLTKGEIMKRYAEFQDPTLAKSFLEGNNFTQEIIDAIEKQITPQDKKFVDGAMKMFKKQREKINPVFSRINGIKLPDNPFYTPIKRVGFEVSTEKGLGEFIEEATYRKAVTTSSLKSRVKSLLPIKKQNIYEVIDKHFTETNYYVAWAEKIRELDTVFKDQNVRFVIEDQYGSSMKSSVDNMINDLATNGNKTARRSKVVDWFRKNFTVGVLMGKPALAAKQYVSTLAYLEVVNPVDFAVGVADFWKNPIKNSKIMNDESIFIKTRGQNIERDIKAAMKTDVFKRYSVKQNFINTMMMNVQLGDKGAILTGTWAMRRALLKKGVDMPSIIAEYEKFGSSTQQSSDLSQLSEVQRGGSLEQLFTHFKSSQRQYFAKELQAVKSLFQKGGTSKKNIGKVAKTIAIYHIMLPMAFQFVSNLGGWSDEDKKDYLRAGILGSMNGIYIAGDMIDSIIRTALGLQVWDLELPITDIVKDVNRAVKKIDIDDITIEDMFEATKEMMGAGNALGIPVSQSINIASGIDRVMNGDVKNGTAQILGWSEFSLGIKKKKPTKKKKGKKIKIKRPKIKVKKIKIKRPKIKKIKIKRK